MEVSNRFYTRLCLATVAFFSLFRLSVMGRVGLGDSESYYWAWSQHLDFSYYDHPPMVAWLIRLFTGLGGDTSFMVRLPSVLLFIVLGWLFYRISMDMFDDARVAFYSILTFNLTPVFGIAALQMVPDIPSAVCYLAYVLILSRLLKNQGPGWLWYVLGVVLGVGALGKYFAILLVPSTLILVAVVPEYRFWFKRPEPYIMGLVALFVFAPVFIWNFTNDWPSFRFHLTDRHSGAGFSLRNLEKLVAGQALYMTPLYLAGFLWAVIKGTGKALSGDRRYAALVSFSFPTLLFFYIVCAWTSESEPHWPAFGYLTATIMMCSLGIEGIDRQGTKIPARLKAGFFTATGLAGIAFILFYVHLFHPILPIKPKYDIVNELYGWDKVGANVERIFNERPIGERSNTFLLARHWVLCSQLMFSTGGRLQVACINKHRDQFDFWDDEKKLIGKNAIIITDLRFDEPPDTLYRFDTVEKIMEIPVKRGGSVVRKFTIWTGEGFGGSK
ncbi:hypothetical protein MNBD_NITROSPINAE04-138 [hydrothermal vent metagenome]|uniref:Glycosyltransferase RgtA/B/C/D-like domain-containing protein n=1 Tax=hydrothermal vent metagenome TaxID=652676 RepID=A0A3B1BTZ5_9ZZZZ